jgi:hypothetical protein
MHFTRCLRADRKRPGLLYAGSEYGMYISYDGGVNWKPFQLNLPVLSVTDIAIKENDLIVGTQGRSIYILDDLSVVQQAGNEIASKALHVFAPAPAYRMAGGGRGFGGGAQRNAGMNPPNGIVIPFYVKEAGDSAKLKVTVMDNAKKEIKTFSTTSKENKIELRDGLNQFVWNMNYPDAEKIPEGTIVWNGNVNGPKAIPGNYFAKFKMGKDSVEVPFSIKADPNYIASPAEYAEQFNFLLTARDKFSEVIKALQNIKELRKQMTEFKEKWTVDSTIKDVTSLMDSTGKKLTAIEEALHQTKAKSGQDVLNYPIRLDDKLSNIYGNAAAGNGALSKQSKEAYAVISGLIDEQLNKLKNILNTDIVQLNQLIRQKALPVIGLKKEMKEKE